MDESESSMNPQTACGGEVVSAEGAEECEPFVALVQGGGADAGIRVGHSRHSQRSFRILSGLPIVRQAGSAVRRWAVVAGEREPLERLMHIAHAANERVPADSPQLLRTGALGTARPWPERMICVAAACSRGRSSGNDGDGPVSASSERTMTGGSRPYRSSPARARSQTDGCLSCSCWFSSFPQSDKQNSVQAFRLHAAPRRYEGAEV